METKSNSRIVVGPLLGVQCLRRLFSQKKTSNMASNKVPWSPCKLFGFLIEFPVSTRFGRAS